jgi:quercetin dioxygenase-like cupin family protein
MKKKGVMTLSVLAGLVAGVAYAKSKEAVLWPAAELKWEEVKFPPTMKLPEGAKPPQYVALWGDMNKGAHGAFVKLHPGEQHPLHTHSSDLKGVVLEGTFTIGAEGAEPKKLGPGSYFLVPARWKHTSSCTGPAPCTIFQEGPGKFDMKPVPVPEAKK